MFSPRRMHDMTVAQKVGRVFANAETATRATEFAALAKFLMAHKGNMSNAAVTVERSSREGNLGPNLAGIIKSSALHGIISREAFANEKAAVVAGGLTGSPLADYSAISSAFVNSLVNVGAFDTMLASMVPVPLATGTAGAITT